MPPVYFVAFIFLAAAVNAAEFSGAAPSDGLDRSGVGADSSGAQIDLRRVGETVQIRGVYVNDAGVSDTCSYELTVRRDGGTGTMRTNQSGSFETVPGRTDTLSTVRVTAQPGDRLVLRLVIRTATRQIDEHTIERTLSDETYR